MQIKQLCNPFVALNCTESRPDGDSYGDSGGLARRDHQSSSQARNPPIFGGIPKPVAKVPLPRESSRQSCPGDVGLHADKRQGLPPWDSLGSHLLWQPSRRDTLRFGKDLGDSGDRSDKSRSLSEFLIWRRSAFSHSSRLVGE